MSTGEMQAISPPAGEDSGRACWVAIGDSFTAGVTPHDPTWPAIVDSQLSRPTQLVNLAWIGARVAEIEAEQLPLAAAAEPALIAVICGANDVVRSVRPAFDALAMDLDRLFGRISEELAGCEALTATYPRVASGALRPRTHRRIEAGIEVLNALIRRLAPRHGLNCVELANHPGQADLSNYADDGIHPSPGGHRAAAAALTPAIEQLINAERKATR